MKANLMNIIRTRTQTDANALAEKIGALYPDKKVKVKTQPIRSGTAHISVGQGSVPPEVKKHVVGNGSGAYSYRKDDWKYMLTSAEAIKVRKAFEEEGIQFLKDKRPAHEHSGGGPRPFMVMTGQNKAGNIKASIYFPACTKITLVVASKESVGFACTI